MDEEKIELLKIGIPSVLIWLFFLSKYRGSSGPIGVYLAIFMGVMLFILFFSKTNGKKLKLDMDGFTTAFFGSILFSFIATILSLVIEIFI